MTDRKMILKKNTIFGAEVLVVDKITDSIYVYGFVDQKPVCIHREDMTEAGIKEWIGTSRVTGSYN